MNNLNNKQFNEKDLSKSSFNLGLQILKMLLCLWVVLIHSCVPENETIKKLLFKKRFHVPTFTVISFYFLFPIISTRNIEKIKQRFTRLLIPYIIIPLIIWIFNNIVYFIFHINRVGRKLYFINLFNQFIIGRDFHGVFWYQSNILFITLLFFIISFIFKNIFLIILKIFLLIAYIFQYSGYNVKLFSRYNFRIKYSIGNIIEMIPFAVVGLSIGSMKILEKLEKKKFYHIFLSFSLISFLYKYSNVFINLKGFWYPGLINNIGAILLFIIFSLLSFSSFQNNRFFYLLKNISNYTGGIYYFHPIIRDYLNIMIYSKRKTRIDPSIIIYRF